MYAKGMTPRQIPETIEDINGFKTSEGMGSIPKLHTPDPLYFYINNVNHSPDLFSSYISF